MLEAVANEARRRRRQVSWLLGLAAIVVLVDAAAGVFTILSDHATDKSRASVTSGLAYIQDTGNLMQAVLEAESDVRGYVLTGDKAYLQFTAVVKDSPKLATQIKRDSIDPKLRADYARLAPLLRARVVDLVATLKYALAGNRAAATAVIKTGKGREETNQIRTLIDSMVARSNMLVSQARAASRHSQKRASIAGIVAYLASGVLLVMMVLLLRRYRQAENERRISRIAQIEAERLTTAKTGFLSRVSHELRTPLNAILGFGQLLEREPLEAGQRETLDQMLSGGRHLLAIVDDLLDLSRVETGELRLSTEPIQVIEAVQEARSLMSGMASAAAVGLRNRQIDDSLYVLADNQRLMQVLLNLISNGIKYNRRGGNVVISAQSTVDHVVRFEIVDTGMGIAAEDIPQLFVPFQRLDAPRRGIEGTGLGLAVARGLVEAMGGRLDLTSKVGVGTTIWFELPVSSADALVRPPVAEPGAGATAASDAAADAGAVAAEHGKSGTTVLYIEDNPSNVRLVEKVMALRPEIELHIGRDGTTGLALARSIRPSVVLLDLHLPDISGEQVLAALLANADTANTPVIIVSADASPMQAKRLRAAGASGYLTKPFDVDQLLDAVRRGGTVAAQEDQDEDDQRILDPGTVNSLHMLSANPAVGPSQIGEMLSTFRGDSASTLAAMRDGLAAGNLDLVAREAHRLAGGSGTFGAGRFRLACRSIEEAAKRGDVDTVRELDATLDELREVTWAALQEEFPEELAQVADNEAGPVQ